jgi:long-chain acyl-CoA synthetase
MSIDVPDRCGAAVARTLARLAKQVEVALAQVDLSLSQYRVLVYLSEADGAAASALAIRLDVSRPSVTALIDGLETRGLVARRVAAEDRRRVEHRLTPAGETALARADAAVAGRLDVIVDQIDDRRAQAAVLGVEHWGDALTLAREKFFPLPPGGPDAPARP